MFIPLEIRVITRRRVQGRRSVRASGGGGHQTRQSYDKSPSSEIYTTWACILSDHNVFGTLRGGGKTAGSNAPGAFLVLNNFYWPMLVT